MSNQEEQEIEETNKINNYDIQRYIINNYKAYMEAEAKGHMELEQEHEIDEPNNRTEDINVLKTLGFQEVKNLDDSVSYINQQTGISIIINYKEKIISLINSETISTIDLDFITLLGICKLLKSEE